MASTICEKCGRTYWYSGQPQSPWAKLCWRCRHACRVDYDGEIVRRDEMRETAIFTHEKQRRVVDAYVYHQPPDAMGRPANHMWWWRCWRGWHILLLKIAEAADG